MKILIITALSLEFQAVEKHLQQTVSKTHPVTGSKYKSGKYITSGRLYDVLIVEAGAGNNRAADETGRAIQYFMPDFTFFVGIAGGVKDVKIGDVVASSKVIGFEVGKAKDEFLPRLDTIPASYRLEQIAKDIARDASVEWQKKILMSGNGSPVAYVQPIAAGEKVVSSTRSETFNVIKKYCSDALAIDMEGIGFLVAARPYTANAIEVRGISDMLDKKEEADATGSQPIAAGHAAAFTFAIIDRLGESISINQDPNSSVFKKKLVNVLVELYPQGPEQDDIWKRAGGDISILVNSSSRKSQWFNAVEKLALGGGGKSISVESLINEVKDDYPNAVNLVFEI
jgi:adenosylhomocysteine nucleosidase